MHDTRFLHRDTMAVLDAIQLQHRHPAIGAPQCLTEDELAMLGYDLVEVPPPPPLSPGQTHGVAALSRGEGGWRLGTPVVDRPPEPVEAVRARARIQVDGAAETARMAWITPGSGQALSYLRKAAEARDHVAGGPGPWPHLEAELGTTAATLAEVAAVVLTTEAGWARASARIEAIRLAAKRAIDRAEDAAAVDAVVAAIAWPTPA